MARRIKSVAELPGWFQLKKYDKAKELDATGWYEQLSVRESAHTITTWFNDPENNKMALADMQDFGDVMKLIRENPIVDVMSSKLLKSYFSDKPLTELKPKKPCYSRGVHPVTGEEFLILLNSLKTKRVEILMEWWNDHTRFLDPQEERWLDEPLHNIPFFDTKYLRSIVSINWDLPDAMLVEHFKQFLITNRKEYNSKYYPIGIMRRSNKLNIKDWHGLAILPYLDLMIWKEEEKVSIPNRVMANAIYPPGEYGEETIRKTTAPLAEDLILEQTLELLASQAAFEIMEKNKK